jgi:hypothetical protein
LFAYHTIKAKEFEIGKWELNLFNSLSCTFFFIDDCPIFVFTASCSSVVGGIKWERVNRAWEFQEFEMGSHVPTIHCVSRCCHYPRRWHNTYLSAMHAPPFLSLSPL